MDEGKKVGSNPERCNYVHHLVIFFRYQPLGALSSSRATPPINSHRAVCIGASSERALNLEWSDVDLPRKEFTLRYTKNDEVGTEPMTPKVYRVLPACGKQAD